LAHTSRSCVSPVGTWRLMGPPHWLQYFMEAILTP
jgi:hypothetical protein